LEGAVRDITFNGGNARKFSDCEGSQAVPARPSGEGRSMRSRLKTLPDYI
jgi:hypothetical protein